MDSRRLIIANGVTVDLSEYLLKSEAETLYATLDGLNNKQDKLISGTNIKTVNGTSILGNGNIVISGGGSSSGGSSAYSEVNHGTSDTTFTLTPNTFHVWDEVTSLTLDLGSETSGVVNEYLFQFNSGATATSLTLPDDIKWANDAPPTIEENMIYQVSILKGLASVLSWENAPEIEIINFNCIVDSLHAEAGMTWGEWINSSYNNGKYSQDGGMIIRNGDSRVTYQGNYVNLTDAIIPNAFYTNELL